MSFLDDYQPVEDRLREFWERHPAGRIVTELLSHHGADYIVRAAVYRGDELRDGIPAATGLAHDSPDALSQNMKASALEVCETSAIGRALANLGFAPKGQRPSREEMQKTAAGGVAPKTTPPPAAPSSEGDARPDTTSYGEGEAISEGSPSDTQPALPIEPPTLDELVSLTGSLAKARELINETTGATYTPRNIRNATAMERFAALHAYRERRNP